MKADLAVIGQGAVSPGGIGVEALQHAPLPDLSPELRRPDQAWPVLRVDLKSPELQRWQKEARLRRASPLTLFLIEAAEQALVGISNAERARTGLVIALSAGCLLYSRRFFEGIINEGQKRASPMLFPETVFNSPGSHVAATLKLNGAAYALVGDEACWVGALKTAAVWLKMKRVEQVLVLGGEEFDALVLDAYCSARWLRRSGPLLASEGAAALLVRSAQPNAERVITTLLDGYTYRTAAQATSAAARLFGVLDSQTPCYPTARRNWLGRLEKTMIADWPLVKEDAPYLGEAFAASAGWNTLRALNRLSPGLPSLYLPIWGLNHQLAAIGLRRDAGLQKQN